MFNTEGVKLKNNKKDFYIPKVVFNPSILFGSPISLPAFSSNSSPNKFRNFEILEKLISKTLNDETKELTSKSYNFHDKFSNKRIKSEPINEDSRLAEEPFTPLVKSQTETKTRNVDNFKIEVLDEKTTSWDITNSVKTSCVTPKEEKDDVITTDENKRPIMESSKPHFSDSWQSQKSTLSKKLVHLYITGTLSDVLFQVGTPPKIKNIKGHKLLFAMCSEVFESIINAHPNNIIPITDVQIEIFEKIAMYVYKIKPDFKSSEEAKNTIKAAVKYNLPKLIKLCCDFLGSKLNLNNIFSEYEKAILHNDRVMIDECRKFLDRNFRKILLSENFLKLSCSKIINIIQHRKTNPKDEILLFDTIKKWAKEKCVTKKQDATLANMRVHMQSLLPHIRFLNMKNTEFISGPAKSGILTQSEITSILMSIDYPESSQLPAWCNRNRNQQGVKKRKAKPLTRKSIRKVQVKKKKTN